MFAVKFRQCSPCVVQRRRRANGRRQDLERARQLAASLAPSRAAAVSAGLQQRAADQEESDDAAGGPSSDDDPNSDLNSDDGPLPPEIARLSKNNEERANFVWFHNWSPQKQRWVYYADESSSSEAEASF